MREFNLSIYLVDDERSQNWGFIHSGWVKEFVEELKDGVYDLDTLKLIDKLAGKEFK